MAGYKRNLSKVVEHLEKGETIKSSVFGVYETKSMGSKTIKNGVFVVTEKRIVFFAKRFFGFDLESFPLKNISSIEKSKGMMGYSFVVHTSGNSFKMQWINKGDINGFYEYVTQNVGITPAYSAGTGDIAEKIQKLIDLKEKGLISENEFTTKKSELLSLM